MNTLTEHDRKLAETLRSLTLEPPADVPTPGRKRIGWIVSLMLAGAIPALVWLVWPETLRGIAPALPGRAEPAEPQQAADATALRSTSDRAQSSPISRPSASVAREITGSGYVVAPRSILVFSKYEGRVKGIAVDVGDRVEAGQQLLTLEDESASLTLEQEKAAKVSADLVLSAKDITLAQATAAFHRADVLTQRNAGPRKDLEEAEASWKNALAGIEQARQDVVRADLTIRVAQEHVDELAIRAPFAGTVTKLNAHMGDTVLARADSVRESQSLLTLTDTTSLVIDADIAETNLSLLRPGLVGEATLDGIPGRTFRVELQRIAPIVSADKGTIGLRLSLINPPVGIRPNMAARISLSVPETQDQIGVSKP